MVRFFLNATAFFNGLCGCLWNCSYGATVMHLCVQCHIWMGSIPIRCDCDVSIHYVSIQIAVTPCEQFHKITCKKTQSHWERIAPCEQAIRKFNCLFTLWSGKYQRKSVAFIFVFPECESTLKAYLHWKKANAKVLSFLDEFSRTGDNYQTRMHSSRMRTGPRKIGDPPEKLETPPKNWRPPKKIGDSPSWEQTPPGLTCKACCHTHPPLLWTEWMTDRCKNITLAKTSFRPVIKCSF